VIMVFGVYAALAVFIAVLRINRHWWLSEHLFSQWGPRTDVPCMKRRELFAEGLRFLLLGALCFAVFITLAWVLDRLRVGETPAAIAITFLAFILSAMGFAAAAYLFLRGLFRGRRYILPPECYKHRIANAPAPVPVRPPLAPAPVPAPSPARA